jgi:hypothetical protein
MSTEVNGLWYSHNINSPTPIFTEVQSYKFRQPERIFYNPYNVNEVWVTSFGNGIKRGYTSAPVISLGLTVFIEGFWNGVTQVQDTVRVYLRNGTSPYVRVDSASAILNASGYATVNFPNAVSGNYYLEISHRNALETWSSTPVSLVNGSNTDYDFSTTQSKAYGNNLILKNGKWSLYSGDTDGSGIIELGDILNVYNDGINFVSGYTATDVNGDNIISLDDILIVYNNAAGFVAVISP